MANARIEGTCRRCTWPVVFVLCNDVLATTEPFSAWDWWVYCSNPVCGHHGGEGVFQIDPEWWQRN